MRTDVASAANADTRRNEHVVANDGVMAYMGLAPDDVVVAYLGERLQIGAFEYEAVLSDLVVTHDRSRAYIRDQVVTLAFCLNVEALAIAIHPPPAHRQEETYKVGRERGLDLLESNERQIEEVALLTAIGADRESDDTMWRIRTQIVMRLERIIAHSKDNNICHVRPHRLRA
jgi:hypothetical protein